MISKSQVSFVKSLHQKKYRKEHQLFIVEGYKAVSEFAQSDFGIDSIFYTPDFSAKVANLSNKRKDYELSPTDLKKISLLQNPQGVLALVQMPENQKLQAEFDDLVLVLDGVQDPGNLGTIIRTADWFGFKQLVCSEDCVEVYNPKVVQATMGSLTRVKVNYQNLNELFAAHHLPKYGMLLNGENIFNTVWPQKGFVVLGSEGNGISEGLLSSITHPLTIPGGQNTESLNVAIAGAICCAEIRRNKLK
ncbi:RNA methyltransferase [Pelobium manganitolerans]|uniref:RNA methyltransferase n=1 Tax=Pelobium manganitolerans TaxID=1842495 RepID=A0A419S664_9SPHI|nr:RNA methyltransferase [Pelobium manganitolerans]RKD16303.1 RNA methyltransferase [Pelobium manganitolerans]